MSRHLTLVASTADDLALVHRDPAVTGTLRHETRSDMVMARVCVAREPNGLGGDAA